MSHHHHHSAWHSRHEEELQRRRAGRGGAIKKEASDEDTDSYPERVIHEFATAAGEREIVAEGVEGPFASPPPTPGLLWQSTIEDTGLVSLSTLSSSNPDGSTPSTVWFPRGPTMAPAPSLYRQQAEKPERWLTSPVERIEGKESEAEPWRNRDGIMAESSKECLDDTIMEAKGLIRSSGSGVGVGGVVKEDGSPHTAAFVFPTSSHHSIPHPHQSSDPKDDDDNDDEAPASGAPMLRVLARTKHNGMSVGVGAVSRTPPAPPLSLHWQPPS